MPKAELWHEKLDKILEAHRKGFRDLQKTVVLVTSLLAECPKASREPLIVKLESLVYNPPLPLKPAGGFQPSEGSVALLVLADLIPTERLARLAFTGLKDPITNESIEAWLNYIYPHFRGLLAHRADRFDGDALSYIKAFHALMRSKEITYSNPRLLQAIDDLNFGAEYAEYERFEKTLLPTKQEDTGGEKEQIRKSLFEAVGLDSGIERALRDAASRLGTQGEFDAKSAADLLRSAIDQAHRGVVRQLERIKNKPYRGADKDGFRRDYMCSAKFISEAEKKFFGAIYSLISEEASHQLVAPRETVLLLHRTVSEYLVLIAQRLRKELATTRQGHEA